MGNVYSVCRGIVQEWVLFIVALYNTHLDNLNIKNPPRNRNNSQGYDSAHFL